MKAAKSVLLLALVTALALSFTIAAPQAQAAAETRVVYNNGGQPNWFDHNGFNSPSITVKDSTNYKIYVTFRDSSTGVISTFSVDADSTSPAMALPTNAKYICVAKISAGTPEDCLTSVYYDIPTLSEWALIVFGALLVILMTYYVIRRRRVAHSTVA